MNLVNILPIKPCVVVIDLFKVALICTDNGGKYTNVDDHFGSDVHSCCR